MATSSREVMRNDELSTQRVDKMSIQLKKKYWHRLDNLPVWASADSNKIICKFLRVWPKYKGNILLPRAPRAPTALSSDQATPQGNYVILIVRHFALLSYIFYSLNFPIFLLISCIHDQKKKSQQQEKEREKARKRKRMLEKLGTAHE